MESPLITTAFGRTAPEKGHLVGYGAIILHFGLQTPIPRKLALVVNRRGRSEQEEWLLFAQSYKPDDELYQHLVFSLKYEGIDLHLLKVLFERLGKNRLTMMLQAEPGSQYSRRIWFLYEWLFQDRLPMPDLSMKDYFDLLNPKLQYAGPSTKSRRHGIRNNLPGTVNCCPLIWKTDTLETLVSRDLSEEVKTSFQSESRDLLMRAAAFMLLEDSRASYAIEGERPPQNRAQRWGSVIGLAGTTHLSREELERLQQILIEKPRFNMGYRAEEGFVGSRDIATLDPVPSHISARYKDIELLMDGLIKTHDRLVESDFDAILAATLIAFGFVFIHPFVDGNGRIHRYLIHHLLVAMGFAEKGIVFPVSSVILERVHEYRRVLEDHSFPHLELIDWTPTQDHNVRIENETIDLYRYFDATRQAEFLYDCVRQTIEENLPREIEYLRNYDRMKAFLDNSYDFPDKTISLLIAFLRQGNGILSDRARTKEFADLNQREVETIQNAWRQIFSD